MTEPNAIEKEINDSVIPEWSDDAPKGGKAVLNRIIKEKATVPLFFGQTLISSLRDMGYNSTTSALCEHVDNAIQWGATEVRVYFHQSGKKGNYQRDVLVLDNGQGMSPNVLKMATSFGGSMVYGNRSGIGRFGMGMKTAALSLSPIMDLYSWQEPGAFYNMTLDVDAIGRERSNLIELPDPTLMDKLPSQISDILVNPLAFPDSNEQELLADSEDDVTERLGKSGTIVFMPACDRLTSIKARTLVDQAVREMSRVYRRYLTRGIRLFINNRLVEPFDPTYTMPQARHTRIPELRVKQSRLVTSKIVLIDRKEGVDHKKEGEERDAVPITVRLYALPIEDWGPLPLKVRKNDLHLYDDHTISFMRNDREVFIGTIPDIVKRHSDANWFRVQVDITGELDEAFGVAANKQGVRPKKYVLKEIAKELHEEIAALREQIRKYQSEQTVAQHGSRQSAGENQADEAEGLQPKPLLQAPAPVTPDEQAKLDDNLRALSLMLKRENETDEEAFDRVKRSKHIIHFKHDEYWPFYHVDHRYGRIILTINTAHPFYSKLYKPLSNAASGVRDVANDESDDAVGIQTFQGAQDALVALQLLLLSLARSQSLMSLNDDERRQIFDQFRKEWSVAYQTQLLATAQEKN